MAGDYSEAALGRKATFDLGTVSASDMSKLASHLSSYQMHGKLANDASLGSTSGYNRGGNKLATAVDHIGGRKEAFSSGIAHNEGMKTKRAERVTLRTKGYGAKG